MKKLFTIILGILLSIALVFAIGFHNANEILPGTFNGSYKFMNGNLGIGTDTPFAKLEIKSSATGTSSVMLRASENSNLLWFVREDPDADGAMTLRDKTNNDKVVIHSNENSYFNGGNIGIGNTNPLVKLDVEGTIEYDGLQAESDIRLKKNINNYNKGLDEISKLRGVSFDWKNSSSNRTQIGLIAQEVEVILPEMVITKEDGYKSIAYVDLIIPLINSVKELKQENENLRERIELLEN